MGSVEVDAKIRGDDGATLQEPSKYHTRDELQKEVIDLDRLNPDVNGDGIVAVDDILILLSNFGCTGPTCTGDIDGDEVVGVSDILSVLSSFSLTCFE